MVEAVYLLCALTSVVCAVLLFRGYRRSRTGLLLWSSLCFVGLAINNALLLVDVVVLTEVNYGIVRTGIALISFLVLLYGLVWELT